MTSYRLRLSPKDRKAGRFIAQVHRELQRALIEVKGSAKLTQQALANALGVNRSVINRRFLGKANLTLRSIGEIAWALNKDIVFELRSPEHNRGKLPPRTSTVEDEDGIVLSKSLARPIETASDARV